MTHYDADSRDPGLAAERTDLAWNRSGMSLIACGAAVMRGIARPPLITKGESAVGACIMTLGAFTWALGSWHVRRSRARRERPTSAADLVPVSVGVALVGIAAFVLAALFAS
jgi:uncharacterized membrane protein YidH (DUF202 family)